MMGLGYLGSSSSSNLSPLAPPFTVDRSKPALNSNPVSHFNDAFCQSTGWQEFFGDSSTTRNEYGYIVSDSTTITHNWGGLSSNGSVYWSHVNTSPKRVDDSLFYNMNEAKSFEGNVDDIPLVSFNDYTQSLSGLEYNPNSKLKQEVVRDEKLVKRMDSVFLKEANIGAYNNCLNQAKPSDINIPEDTSASADEDSPCWKGTPPFPTIINLDDKKTSAEVVDSSKLRDGGDDDHAIVKPNTSNINLQQQEADNTSALVKALYNLSDRLLQACSNQALLNAHDHEALDHVTRNLGACMSSQVQVATNKHSYAFQEKHAAAAACLDSPSQGVQAIKKILEENLECEAEDTLYKNLWLEAEAELFSLSYRARFHRVKTQSTPMMGDRRETLKGSTFQTQVM